MWKKIEYRLTTRNCVLDRGNEINPGFFLFPGLSWNLETNTGLFYLIFAGGPRQFLHLISEGYSKVLLVDQIISRLEMSKSVSIDGKVNLPAFTSSTL
jgi:hypothetical protein